MAERSLDLMRLKLRRADERLHALQRQLDQWGKRHPVIIRTKLDFQPGWHTCYVHKTEPLPMRFAVPIGESLYHGRSALDHLIWALVKANHKPPSRINEFPILKAPPDHRKGERERDAFIRVMRKDKLTGVNLRAAALIESLQPYNRGNVPTYFLTVLHEMARDDRHHALHATYIGMADPRNMVEPRLDIPSGVTIIDWEPLFEAGKSLKAGTKLARFRLSRYRRQAEVGMKTDLPVDVAFGDRPIRAAGFSDINRHLRELLSLFEEFL